jgi:DNA-binding transcriptional regulator/RsmH inhibitor MraZ
MPLSNPDPEAKLFLDSYPFTVDGQCRVTIPADWRFKDGAEFFIRVDEAQNFLLVLPRWELERFREHANTLTGPDRVEALMEWSMTTCRAVVDQGGRLTLPRDRARQVGIEPKRKVLLIGAMEFFQIWDAERWEQNQHIRRARGKALLAQY